MADKCCILIVDDSLTVGVDLQDLFEQAGHTVVICRNLAEARRVLLERKIHLILLDVILPDGDGTSLLKEIKSNPKICDLPVMILSSESEVRDRLRGIAIGAVEYVGKPYDRSFLIGKANELLGNPSKDDHVRANPHILVIDDSATSRERMKILLEGGGYIPFLAESGEEGIKMASVIRPDAMIVDGMLPGIDGPTVVRRVRSDLDLQDTPCIVLTDSKNTQDEFTAFESGSDAYIQKGEDNAVILARLGALLRVSLSRQRRTSFSMLGPKRILAADDSPTYLTAIAEPLREDGYDVVAVLSGEEALALMEAQEVDCVLLDFAMPGISGQETCRRIKTSEGKKNIPVIMLTGREDREAMLESFSAGADDYIPKSNEFVVLKARVRAQLRRSQFEEENRRIREDLAQKKIEAIESRASHELAEQRGALLNKLEVINTELQHKNDELEEQRATLEAEKKKLETLTIELAAAQREAMDKAKEAQVASQYKSEFLANMSHELRTPLNAIMVLSQLTIENQTGNLSSLQIENAKSIYSSGKDLLGLIDEVLDLSKVEAGKLDIFAEECLILDLIARLREVFLPQMQLKKLGFRVEVAEDAPKVLKTDYKRVEQILKNLISNALKFTEKGEVKVIFFRPSTIQGYTNFALAITVKDTGIGIPEDKQKYVFREFTQLGNSTRRQYQGTGLGLAISLRLAQRLGGNLILEKNAGPGTSFTLYLPLNTSLDLLSLQ